MIIRICILLLLSFRLCYGQHVDWDYQVYSTYSPIAGSWGGILDYELDEFGRVYIFGVSNDCQGCQTERNFRQIDHRNPFASHAFNEIVYVPKGFIATSHFNSFYGISAIAATVFKKSNTMIWSIPYFPYDSLYLHEDYSQNVYVWNNDSLSKYNSTATLLWSKSLDSNFVSTITDLKCDYAGNVFISGNGLTKTDSFGSILWTYPCSTTSVVMDSAGNSYVRSASGSNLEKLDPGGNLIFSTPQNFGELAVDNKQMIYTFYNGSAIKFDSTANTILWSVPLSHDFKKLSTDANENLYLLAADTISNGFNNLHGFVQYVRISGLEPHDTIITSVAASLLCSGDSIDVYFTATPVNSSITAYEVQLSDSAGNFTTPLILGYCTSSPVRVLIPGNVLAANNYKIRVTAHPYDSRIEHISTNSFSINKLNISFSLPSITCVNYQPINLNALPAGGNFYGTGVNGTTFLPSLAGVGTQSVTYILSQGNCTDSLSNNIVVDECLGMSDFGKENIGVFPNPFTSIFSIAFATEKYNHVQFSVKVIDLLNREIKIKTITSGDKLYVDCSYLNKGVYVLQLQSKEENFVSRIIKN